jgi:hypothetical protein
MKRMRFAMILLTGLVICGWLVWRQSRQKELFTEPRDQRAFDAWQGAIQLDQRTNYDSGNQTPPELIEAETEQKPEEGRN